MKRILYITNYKEGVGGISGQVEFLHKNLDSDFESEIFNTRGGLFKRIFFFFILFIKGAKFDVFHIHGCSNWGGFYPFILGITIGKLLRKKVIVTYHGGGAELFFSKHKRIIYFYLKKANHIIVLSDFLSKIFEKYNLKTTTIPNLIDIENNTIIEKQHIRPKFICTRSLAPIYNILCVINAFHIIQKQYADAELILVGDGSERLSLEKYVSSHEIENVKFVGRIKNEEINKYLKNSDIWLNASLIDNMPVSLLEAFNCGLLVISSNAGGIVYMVENKINGLLMENNKPETMAEKIVFALKNQDESKQMILAAKKSIEDYSWEKNKTLIYSLYKQQLTKRNKILEKD